MQYQVYRYLQRSLTTFYYDVVHFCIVLCSIAFCQFVKINGLFLLLLPFPKCYRIKKCEI